MINEIEEINSIKTLKNVLCFQLFDKNGVEINQLDEGLVISRLIVIMCLEPSYILQSIGMPLEYEIKFLEAARSWFAEVPVAQLESGYYLSMLVSMYHNPNMAFPALIAQRLLFQPFYTRRSRYQSFMDVFEFLESTVRRYLTNDKAMADFQATAVENIKSSLIHENYNTRIGQFL